MPELTLLTKIRFWPVITVYVFIPFEILVHEPNIRFIKCAVTKPCHVLTRCPSMDLIDSSLHPRLFSLHIMHVSTDTSSVSDPFYIYMDPDPTIFSLTFFYQKYISPKKWFVLLCMRYTFISVKQKFNIKKKKMIFLIFCLIFVEIFLDFGWYYAMRADPDPTGRNKTDPNPKHWILEKLIMMEMYFVNLIL